MVSSNASGHRAGVNKGITPVSYSPPSDMRQLANLSQLCHVWLCDMNPPLKGFLVSFHEVCVTGPVPVDFESRG